ncbi:MAG: hypothetical protein JW959_13030 [Pirellulales bacterium]|nr:hypothetical protein [Pirellulales bacterium]
MTYPDQRQPETTDRLSRLQAGIAQLADARVYADDRQCDPWEFAVALEDLVARGLTVSDLRWLVSKGYAEHAGEVTGPQDASRRFLRGRNLSFPHRTCVVLTDKGVSFATAVTGKRITLSKFKLVHGDEPAPSPSNATPRWDAQRRELRVGRRVAKRFKTPSPNQETILSAFEEEGWPNRIDDPLRPQAEQDSKCRLHDTIKSLNRHHQRRLIVFRGDGTGQGVRWELIEEAPLVLSAKKARLAA